METNLKGDFYWFIEECYKSIKQFHSTGKGASRLPGNTSFTDDIYYNYDVGFCIKQFYHESNAVSLRRLPRHCQLTMN